MERSTIFNWKIHYFYGHGFNSFLYVHQRVSIVGGQLAKLQHFPMAIHGEVTKIETVGEEYVFGHPTEMARSCFFSAEIGASKMGLHMF